MSSKVIISSEEKGTGNIFIYISYAFLAAILIGIYNSLSEGNIKPLLLSLPFLFISLLFYLLGNFLNNKFNRLGSTPLTINTLIILKGISQEASIKINKNNFNRVTEIELRCLKSSRSSQGTSFEPRVIFEKMIKPKSRFSGDITTLNFDFEIPIEEPCSGEGNNLGHTYWNLSFNFRDGIEIVTRTWTIIVK